MALARLCCRLQSTNCRIVCSLRYQSNSSDTKTNKKNEQKITLFSGNATVPLIATMEEAQKLSKRRNLKLVKVQDMDTKTQRPVFKLISQAQFIGQEQEPLSKEKGTKKPEKMLTIGYRIAEADLQSRLKQISKWLTKQQEVRVVIEGASLDLENSEKIYQRMESTVKEPLLMGKMVQKRTKGNNMKFTIVPVKQLSSKSNKNPDNNAEEA